MDNNQHTDDCKDDTLPHLPMGRLFYLLHSNGFQVKPDDYIEMLKITERFGSADIDETAKWICPIIATSETEQSRFYHIIEQFKISETLPACEPPAPQVLFPQWFKLAIAFFLLFLLLLTLYFSLQKKSWQPDEASKERTVKKGEVLYFNAANLFRNNPADSSRINISWQFDDGSTANGLTARHLFKQDGDHRVIRHFSSRYYRVLIKSDSLLVHVCSVLPKINIQIPAQAVIIKQPVTITASVDGYAGDISGYQWTINDSVFTTPSPIVQRFIFLKEGDYPIECKAIVGQVNGPCTATDNQIIQVLSNNVHYSARFSAAQKGGYPGKPGLKWWVTLVLLLPAAAGLLYSFIKRKSRAITKKELPVASAVSKGPYDIPFEQNDTKLVQPEKDLRHAFVQMRYKAEEETQSLNIAGTIYSIIRSGGSPQLVFAPVTRQQQYLLLIDRANPKSMLTHFFSYLAKSMVEEGLPVVIFYYDRNFICYNQHHPAGLPLQRLADTWHTATLIILGKAHELVYSVYPVIEEKMLQELNRWQSKAIITPIPLEDWAVKEKILQSYMILLPADAKMLQKLIPALREKIRPEKSLLQITDTAACRLHDIDFRDVEALQSYLNSEALFQWLCALCIYPRLTWEVMIEMGKAILDKYGEPESLNYSNLLALCRITWMQQGVFPQATRLELLKRLTTDNEILARETLLHMLNYSTVIYGEAGHFFEEEKKRQVLTNQFILHASDNQHYNQYAGSRKAFRQLWQSDGILDVPVKKYLDKKSGDNWETPVSDGKHSIGLSAYFKLGEIAINKTLRIKKLLVATAAILLVALWFYIGYGGGDEKLSSLVSLRRFNRPQTIAVEMKIIKNFRHCGDSANKRFDQLDGYIEINHKKIPLLYNAKTATAVFRLPAATLSNANALLMFSWDINKSVLTKFNFNDNRLPDSVTIGCLNLEKINRQRLNIRYNDETGYKNMQGTLENALFRYTIDALAASFSEPSRIVYYEPDQKPRADSIAAIVKQAFNIVVAEEYIGEHRTPPAVPILFLNTSASANNRADSNNADPALYHAAADDLFEKKQYRQAIAAYEQAIKFNPRDALAWYQTGLCYEMLGEKYAQEAITSYNSAIIIKQDPAYYYRRGSVNYELKRYQQAISDYDQVIQLDSDNTAPQYLSALYFRGKSKLSLKNLRGACSDFKKAADAGYAAGKQDYGKYCSIGSSAAKPDSGYQQQNANNPAADVQQQTAEIIPPLSVAQLTDMLMEVATGKRTAKDFTVYLRGNDIAVVLNGTIMPFTEMCRVLQGMKNIKQLNVVPMQNQANQITAMTVTTIIASPAKSASKKILRTPSKIPAQKY